MATKRRTERLDDDELKRVINASGYPFEGSLFHQFRKAGFQCAHSLRVPLGVESTELDLLASRRDYIRRDDGRIGAQIQVNIVVEAKRFHPPKEFIGFKSAERPRNVRMGDSARFAGSPSVGILEYGGTIDWAVGLVPALEPMLKGAWCGQWAAVEETNGGKLVANRPSNLSTSLRQLLLGTEMLRQQTSEAWLEPRAAATPVIAVFLPALVLDVEDLRAFNTEDGGVSSHGWLSLAESVDTPMGVRHYQYDAVARSSLELYMASANEVFEGILAATRSALEEVTAACKSHREAYESWLLGQMARGRVKY